MIRATGNSRRHIVSTDDDTDDRASFDTHHNSQRPKGEKNDEL